ncbi:MAG: phospho-N-acetylmuramoyl-pentapeptide-transferase [Alphaproteobacteria bacterium]|nr:MAG: phospho-N-acetylmuramoyl-pentapeptide-transferase [Alphaproteobacteria bacterium]
MLLDIAEKYILDYHFLNVFRYITFRTGGAIFTSLAFCLSFGAYFIRYLAKHQALGQPIRKEGPEMHALTKKGTPTMGGMLILGALVLGTILWSDLRNPYIWIVLFVTCAYGGIGIIDDYLKVKHGNSKGLAGNLKMALQIVIGILALLWIQGELPETMCTTLAFPFVKSFVLDLGVFFIPFGLLVIVGASNAVNLTDGLDGLATVPVMIAAFCFGAITYVGGNSIFATYLQVPHIPGSGELAVFTGALIGSCLGFLWFNAPPAMVFMGDTGSLALGGALGTLAVISKNEIVLAIVGGVFVLEALSVMLQVGYFKITGGKRIFLMTPIHHHFEKKGWKEATIVIRFWIISFILGLIGLATLKLR